MPNSVWASDRFVYRATESSDEAFLLSMLRDPYTTTNLGDHLPAPTSAAEIKEFLEAKNLLKVLACLPSKPGATDPKDMTPVGFVSLFPAGPPHKMTLHRTVNLGIGLAPEYQGKGYGGEIILWATEWGFKHGGMHRIAIAAYEWNQVGCRLYPRLGFREEGREVKGTWHEGRWWDYLKWAMLEDEWLALYGNPKAVTDGSTAE